jgi:putative two-component system hydrogenase maturation factor HypX/HoxX
VLRKIRAADGHPGVLDRVLDVDCRLYGAHREMHLGGLRPGAVIACRDGAICRATLDGAVWITHLKREGDTTAVKLPATRVLGDAAADIPVAPAPVLPWRDDSTWQDIAYEEHEEVGYLGFDFHNGAMSTRDCVRLRDAFRAAAERATRVIVLMGGHDFWSNGIHLNLIEDAPSPADESWANINAMDDLCRAIIECDTHMTVAAMRGNAGAGGVFLALAADRVMARCGITLNPHYKSMGNLFGSEYWTYLLPRRVGWERARAITTQRLPIGTRKALADGLIDEELPADAQLARAAIDERARAMAGEGFEARLEAKRAARSRDEALKPLAAYRDEELARMKLNFYGFDPSYHVARYHFVHKVPHAWTPLHLAAHRRGAWRRRAA